MPTGAQTMMTSAQSIFLMPIVPDAPRSLFSQCFVIVFPLCRCCSIIDIDTPDKLLSSLRERFHRWIHVSRAPDTIHLPFSPKALGSVAFSLFSQNGHSDVEILT
jgi:hypothetical protein